MSVYASSGTLCCLPINPETQAYILTGLYQAYHDSCAAWSHICGQAALSPAFFPITSTGDRMQHGSCLGVPQGTGTPVSTISLHIFFKTETFASIAIALIFAYSQI